MKENILVIDDEETICNLLKDVLTEKGYTIATARDGKAGLKLLQEMSFHTAIVDLKLPDIDGIEILRRISKLDMPNPTIVLTGYPSFETAQEALRLGAYDYITKPFNLDELSFTIKKSIDFYQLSLSNKKLMKELAEENIILEKKVEERTKDLRDLYHEMQATYLSTVKALAQVIEAKDRYTLKHSDNVTKYAVAIAEEMRFSLPEIEEIREASQLHDLGKIGIHDYILTKPSKLTEEEWEEIKLHSLRGAEILKPLTFLNGVIRLIRQHHERYDGIGYPDKLKGEEIVLGARIIAVADSFDAMISERPYRKAYSKEYAICELKKKSGTQFDPQVVATFLRALKKKAGILKRES